MPAAYFSFFTRAVLVFLCLFSGLVPAFAHPHVFVEARSKLVFDDQGYAVSVEHVFRFDDVFTAFAIQGFDRNGDGVYDRDELSELANVNIESMGEYGYFTFGDNSRVELDFNAPPDGYWLEVVDVPLADYWAIKPDDIAAMKEDQERNGTPMPVGFQLLELHFTLPLKGATDAVHPITLDVYDPTYYVDFRFSHRKDAVGIRNAPGNCAVERRDPPPMDAAAAYALSQIGADQRDIPPELQDAAASQVNQMIITCTGAPAMTGTGGKVVADGVKLPAGAGTSETPGDGQAAITAMIGEAVAPESKVETKAQATPTASRQSLADRWFGTIASLQADFYQRLISAMRAFRSSPYAGWWLIGISFAYGIFHAAGPGHGKAVISSYLVANDETLKKGILLSFLSAFSQALTAVLLVGAAAIVLNLTSVAIQDTAWWFEVGSYALVTLLGMSLLWQKLLRPAIVGSDAGHGHHHGTHEGHDHSDHDHEHTHDVDSDGLCTTCGHAHAPTPDMLREPLSIGRAISIILAVGLRPCSGALIVLVFALSQGLIWAGVASTFAMAVGTGITVSLLASLAVGAKGLATKLFGAGSVLADRVHRTIEILGALLVFLLGMTLLIATIGWS